MSEPHFPLFTRLPAELQDLIWQFALPDPRVYEVLDAPAPAMPRSDPANHLLFADIRNEPPPVIAGVCHSARNAVLRRYKPVVLSGTVKFLDLSRDVLLLDSYLQVRRLLKAIRLLSQVDVLRKNMSRIALGTSWGLYAGLQLRLFHRTVQTKRNMTRLLKHLTQFRKLEAVVLVVYQRSAFSLQVQWLDRRCFPWSTPAPAPAQAPAPATHHHPTSAAARPGRAAAPATPHQAYHYNFHVNFNLDNYWLRRPCHSSLEHYFMDEEEEQGNGETRHAKTNADAGQCQQRPTAGEINTQTTTAGATTTSVTPVGTTAWPSTAAAGQGVAAVPTTMAAVKPASYIQPAPIPLASSSVVPTALSVKQTQPRHHDPYDAQPKPHQVRALKATFQKWVDETTADEQGDSEESTIARGPPAKRPRLEAATLTWIYSGISNTRVY